jgi:hypothetical protein
MYNDMKRMNLTENQIKNILDLHSQEKSKKSFFAEQAGSIESQLNQFLVGKCFDSGEIVQIDSKNPNKQFAIKKESKKNPKIFNYFFIDFTYGSYDSTGKFVYGNGKWNCNHLKNTKLDSTPDKDIVTTKTPTNTEIPTNTETPTNTSSTKSPFQTEISDQTPPSKSDCKNTIEAYYKAWKTKKQITPKTLENEKKVVQACANHFEGKWGGILSKIDNYVQILRGDREGGPLSDSKWRIE